MGSMRTRRLGTQGLEVSALGLGTMGMSGVAGMPLMYGAPDEAEGIATIRRALDLGVNFFDTAEVYGPYANEILLGKALAGRRHEALIATKFGFTFSIDNKIAKRLKCLHRASASPFRAYGWKRISNSAPHASTGA